MFHIKNITVEFLNLKEQHLLRPEVQCQVQPRLSNLLRYIEMYCSLKKLTFSHETLPHCTRFSSKLKSERTEFSVRYSSPGDTTLSTSLYASSKVDKPNKELNKHKLKLTNSERRHLEEFIALTFL